MKHPFRLACWLLLLAPAFRADADAPPGRYTIASGTVYDTRTKLTWQQSADSAGYTQSQAASHCTSLGGGWRIPRVSELLSIVDRMKAAAPAIDLTAFADTGSEIFWTSTVSAGSFAYGVDFTDGTNLSLDGTQTHRVRCVR